MRIALVSLDQVWESKDENLKNCLAQIINAKAVGANLVVFPEMTLTGYTMNVPRIAENENDSFTVKKFQSFSKKYNIAILFGVVFKNTNKAVNCAVLVDSHGCIKCSYKKIHPFSFAGEDKVFDAGNEIITTSLLGMSLGVTICYDLRFPELYSALAKSSDVIFNIANWPNLRLNHWLVLLKARAIENQIYIIGVNRTGEDNNKLTYKKSTVVVDPHGNFSSGININEELDIFEVDKKAIEKYRESFLTIRDRKIDFYKKII